MAGSSPAAGDDRGPRPAGRRRRRRRCSGRCWPRRRDPDRPAAHPRVRPAAPRGGRDLARVGHRDVERVGAGVYLQRHVANLRLGMTLELFSACGALVGGLIAFLLASGCSPGCSRRSSAGWRSTWPGARTRARGPGCRPQPAADVAEPVDESVEPDPRRLAPSRRRTRSADPALRRRAVRARLPRPPDAAGIVGSVFAGVDSALLGVGGGHRQGAGDEPRDGRPAAGRDGDQQHDDRDHRDGVARSSTSCATRSTRTSRARSRWACSSARRVGSRLAHRVDTPAPALAVRRRAARTRPSRWP